jgi:hypothetical protein
MIWWLADTARFHSERVGIDALLNEVPWLIAGEWRIDEKARVVWDAEIVVDDQKYPVSVIFPNHFPHSPPIVLAREKERWSGHQYGNGELCLEIGPDNWQSTLTGVDMVRSAQRLLDLERPKSKGALAALPAPSRHLTTQGQDLRGALSRLLVTHDLQYALRHLPQKELLSCDIGVMFHEEAHVYVILSIKSAGGGDWTQGEIPPAINYEAIKGKGHLMVWPDDSPLPSVTKASELRALIGATDPAHAEVRYAVLSRGDQPVGYWMDNSDDSAYRLNAVLPPKTVQRQREGSGQLQGKKVAVVGCGSLGSKIAVSLARAGVREFFLVDDDVMLPDNLVRNELDWREIGTHKASAVSRRIQLVNPGATSTVRHTRVGGQEASGTIETLIQGLGNCDLIIDATANVRARGYIDAAVATKKKPLVWGEVFGGGFGGLIGRHRPGIDPDPASIRASIEAYCQAYEKPAEAAVDYESQVAEKSWIADDSDVSVIAAHTTRYAIDLLQGRSPSAFPHSVYFIGLAKWWIFEAPFDTRPLDVGVRHEAEKKELDEVALAKETAFLGSLINKVLDANKTDNNGVAAAQSGA